VRCELLLFTAVNLTVKRVISSIDGLSVLCGEGRHRNVGTVFARCAPSHRCVHETASNEAVVQQQ
jgi:hypothetical protein